MPYFTLVIASTLLIGVTSLLAVVVSTWADRLPAAPRHLATALVGGYTLAAVLLAVHSTLLVAAVVLTAVVVILALTAGPPRASRPARRR
ncbi:hypothetical protein ACFU99_14290 [Streptomyces sp. NPDC057654]|uniref:hypothetical protein n=1 Tax=Streptomyces sp. NPDC057654 TaxID=3346196 RepID=UPI003679EDCB